MSPEPVMPVTIPLAAPTATPHTPAPNTPAPQSPAPTETTGPGAPADPENPSGTGSDATDSVAPAVPAAQNWNVPGLTDVHLDQLAADLADDHVAIAGEHDPALEAALRKVVAQAHQNGHDFSIVVVPAKQQTYTLYRDIATALQPKVGDGTVLVLGPNAVGSTSTEFSRFVQEKSTADLTLSQPAVAAQQMIDQMTEPSTDWTLITIVLIVVVTIGAVAGRLMALRRRRRAVVPAVGPDAGGADTEGADTEGPDAAPVDEPAEGRAEAGSSTTG